MPLLIPVIDKSTLDILKLPSDAMEIPRRRLLDASGAAMDISGTVSLKVSVPSLNKSYDQTFHVLNKNLNNKVLLGRDFMEKIGLVAFDFKKNKIKLGNGQ